MSILTLDPAASTGYCIANIKNNKTNILEYGFLEIEKKEYDGDRYIDLEKQVTGLVISNNIKEVAIEDFYFSSRHAMGSAINVAFRAIIHMTCRKLNIPYTVIHISNWKKYICGRTRPTKEDKKKYGAKANKIMCLNALKDKFGVEFPEKSISKKTGKEINFRYDIADAVGITYYYIDKKIKGEKS